MCTLNSNDLYWIFEKLDRNGDGHVSLEELRWLLERIGVHANTDELETLVGKTSLDLLDFELFYDTVINQNISTSPHSHDLESDLAKAFEVYDLNGDGFISSEELQSVLSRLGLWNEHCGRDCKSMIRVYDTNSDGLLDFEEFKNMMLFTKS